jgi:hypothetical protein
MKLENMTRQRNRYVAMTLPCHIFLFHQTQ